MTNLMMILINLREVWNKVHVWEKLRSTSVLQLKQMAFSQSNICFKHCRMLYVCVHVGWYKRSAAFTARVDVMYISTLTQIWHNYHTASPTGRSALYKPVNAIRLCSKMFNINGVTNNYINAHIVSHKIETYRSHYRCSIYTHIEQLLPV